MLCWRVIMIEKIEIEGVEISNPNRIVFEKQKIKKIDVVKYYQTISSHILPYIENRLLSVIRCHNGITDSCFIRKHTSNDNPHIKKFDGDKNEEYFYLQDKIGIIAEAQMGTIEFHTWGSKIQKINKPDVMVFDLDPDENMPIAKLRKGVKLLKKLLDDLNLVSFLKTSGGKGYHIVVPFSNCKNWEIFYNFAKKIADLLEATYPKFFTANIRKAERKGKIFVDSLRNGKGATCVSPYSLRAKNGASISMPIAWENLNKIKPNQITIRNFERHLTPNPWQNFFKINQTLK